MNTIKYPLNLFCLDLFIGYIFIMSTAGYSQNNHPYASDKPISMPLLFNIPGHNTESFHITFTPDGQTFYFMSDSGVMVSNYYNGAWSAPIKPGFNNKCNETPFISPDGNKFFFTGPSSFQNDNDIWMIEKIDNGWGEPKNLGSIVNSSSFESGPSVAKNGNLYFRSMRNGGLKIYCSRWEDGGYKTPEILDNTINRLNNIGEPFIAPDENYILFSIYQSGRERIYISFKDTNSWTQPISLGPKINSRSYNGRPCISPDGNYLFFTSGENFDTWRIYQIDWKPLLDSLKNISLPTNIEESNKITSNKFVLDQNYPNPFNPETVISYQLPMNSDVNLKVFDMLGREVATLVDEERSEGEYKVNFNSSNLPSGIYLYQIIAGNYIQSKKMLIIK